MKKLVISSIFVLFALISYGQRRTDLSGPFAKNFKPWNAKVIPATLPAVTATEAVKSQGPSAKNSKPWMKRNDGQSDAVTPVVRTSKKLTGPAAKNHKPWR